MHFTVDEMIKIGVSFMVLLLWVIASDEIEEEKTLKLKIGFDLSQGTEQSEDASLRIRRFEDPPGSVRNLNDDKRNLKRSVKEESSSESDEKDLTKEEEKKKVNLREASEISEESESSEAYEDRVSTRGLSPDDFEPERNPNIHDRFQKSSDTE